MRRRFSETSVLAVAAHDAYNIVGVLCGLLLHPELEVREPGGRLHHTSGDLADRLILGGDEENAVPAQRAIVACDVIVAVLVIR